MDDFPNATLEFEERFRTETACLDYLFHLRWPQGFRCPKCSNEKAWPMKKGVLHCAECGAQTSVTAGTIFQDTHKPLRLWFRAVWYVVGQKNGVSALGLQRVLGLGSYRTAWVWLHKLRKAMVRPGRDLLSGVVEADETYVGGERPGKRGRGAAGKALVFIAAEDKGDRIGRIRMQRIANASAESLGDALSHAVAPGSSVRTDGWKGYAGLDGSGYAHLVAQRSADVGENLLPLVHRVASLLKRWLQGTHQGAVRSTHLDYYLDEFTFRFNRRTSRSRGKLFYRLLQQAVLVAPSPGRAFRGGRH